LKTQEDNLREKRRNKGKKGKEKVSRVEVIELYHKVNLMKIKQSKFEMMCGHFSIYKVKYPLLPHCAKIKFSFKIIHKQGLLSY